MRTELIISTYNWPWALRLVLLSVLGQTRRPDGVCVADDGSDAETRALVESFQAAHPELGLRHVWHEDDGFRKAVILNRAAATSEADYLIFTDGDCLLSPGFVARHVGVARPDRFASGSLIRLTEEATEGVTDEDVRAARVHRRDWLGPRGTFDRATTWLKTMPLPMPLQAALDAAYPIRRTFMGSNASVAREAMLAVNGFDESMSWGGGDKEFGIRLANNGVRGRQLRFTTPVVHLDHKRGYRDAAAVARQRAMIAEARQTGKTWTEQGIRAGAAA